MRRTKSQIIEAANRQVIVEGDLDAIPEFFTPGYIAHVAGKDFSGGQQVVRRMVGTYRRAFSEIEVKIEILVQSPSRIAWLRSWRGKPTGPFRGFPPSQKVVRWSDQVISEIEDGRIAEEWLVTDLAEQLLLARK
ncbi:MAG: ester cyclase [Pirellulaceae bacterium]